MKNTAEALQAVVTRILEGEGSASLALRRAAYENAPMEEPLKTLVQGVAMHPHRVTDQDFAAALAAGCTQDQVFELVVCAAVGQATRQYERALAALDAATRKD